MGARDFQRCSECRALNEPRALFCSRCGASLYGPIHGVVRRKRRRATGAGAAMGFAMLLILAAALFLLAIIIDRALTNTEQVDVFAGQVGTSATIVTTPTSNSGGASSTTTPASGDSEAATQIRPTAAVASSTLKATSTNNYGVTNLLDGDPTTAWNEGADGNGIDEWVQFDFSREVILARIEIANGYQKDDDRYYGNPRVKSMRVEYSNGTTQLVDLLDDMKMQTITPTRQPVSSVRLVIVSVYPGEEWEDTALSEVRFYEAVD